MKSKKNEVKEGVDFLVDPSSGFMVFTKKYHLKRGYCCKSECRNCPYGYKKEKLRF